MSQSFPQTLIAFFTGDGQSAVDITAGQVVTLAWSANHSCTLNDGTGAAAVAVAASEQVAPTAASTVYTLACGTASRQVTVAVAAVNVSRFTSDVPAASASHAALRRHSAGSRQARAHAIAPLTVAVAASGTLSVNPEVTTPYTLSCTGRGG